MAVEARGRPGRPRMMQRREKTPEKAKSPTPQSEDSPRTQAKWKRAAKKLEKDRAERERMRKQREQKENKKKAKQEEQEIRKRKAQEEASKPVVLCLRQERIDRAKEYCETLRDLMKAMVQEDEIEGEQLYDNVVTSLEEVEQELLVFMHAKPKRKPVRTIPDEDDQDEDDTAGADEDHVQPRKAKKGSPKKITASKKTSNTSQPAKNTTAKAGIMKALKTKEVSPDDQDEIASETSAPRSTRARIAQTVGVTGPTPEKSRSKRKRDMTEDDDDEDEDVVPTKRRTRSQR